MNLQMGQQCDWRTVLSIRCSGGFIINGNWWIPWLSESSVLSDLADEDAFYPVNQCYNRRYEYHTTVFRAVYQGDPTGFLVLLSSAPVNHLFSYFYPAAPAVWRQYPRTEDTGGDSGAFPSFWVLFFHSALPEACSALSEWLSFCFCSHLTVAGQITFLS